MARKQKEGGNKTETIAVRITPKQRYLLDLVSRRSHRSISEVVSLAIDAEIERGLEREEITDKNSNPFFNELLVLLDKDELPSQEDILIKVFFRSKKNWKLQLDTNHYWDAEESDRLVILGRFWPALLRHPDEELTYKIIVENPRYWIIKDQSPAFPNYEKIRKDWEKIKTQTKERADNL